MLPMEMKPTNKDWMIGWTERRKDGKAPFRQYAFPPKGRMDFKGLPPEMVQTFQMLALRQGINYNEFFQEIFAFYLEQNPEIEAGAKNLGFTIQVERVHKEERIIYRDYELGKQLERMRCLELNSARRNFLQEQLKRRDIPEEQKQEVVELLNR